MGLTAYVEWDVRTTGSSTNGGGFDPVSGTPGTDYSQQDSAQVTYTDLVIGTPNTTITSVATPFTSAHVGNLINVTSGTNFTVQRIQILSVSGGIATCDKAVGTIGSTGGNGKLGGSLATPTTAFPAITANTSKIWMKSGTYTRTTTLDLSTFGGSSNVQIIGYQTTHGDAAARPLITTSTNSTVLVKISGAPSAWFQNISFSNTASVRSTGIQYDSGYYGIFVNCILDGFSYAIDADFSDAGYGPVFLSSCEIKNSTTKVVQSVRPIEMYDCYIHDNTGNGIDGQNGPGFCKAVRTVFARNTIGIRSYGSTTVSIGTYIMCINCVFYANTSDGIKDDCAAGSVMSLYLENCVFWGNGGYGINCSTSLTTTNQNQNNFQRNCAFGSNTPSARHNLGSGIGDITLTADPFTSSSNFLINSTSGGGVLLAAAGFPGAAFYGTGQLDVGAVQTPSSTPSYPAASSVYSGVDRGDGVTGTLHASNIATAAGGGSNLSAGILQSGVTVDNVTGSLVAGNAAAFSPIGGPIA